jgi:hypothetical protein
MRIQNIKAGVCTIPKLKDRVQLNPGFCSSAAILLVPCQTLFFMKNRFSTILSSPSFITKSAVGLSYPLHTNRK